MRRYTLVVCDNSHHAHHLYSHDKRVRVVDYAARWIAQQRARQEAWQARILDQGGTRAVPQDLAIRECTPESGAPGTFALVIFQHEDEPLYAYQYNQDGTRHGR